jgi:hypothetical protein
MAVLLLTRPFCAKFITKVINAAVRDVTHVLDGRSSPKSHPSEKLSRRTDVLTAKSSLGPICASWKAMKIKAGVILARDSRRRMGMERMPRSPFYSDGRHINDSRGMP